MDRYQYLLVMAACVVATLPLEVFCGARVWRRPKRLVRVLIGPVVIFSAWDIAAIAHHHWRYGRRYVTGVDLPGRLPIEEVVFFLVVPICALLTFEVVSRMVGPDRDRPFPERLVPALGRRRDSRRGAEPAPSGGVPEPRPLGGSGRGTAERAPSGGVSEPRPLGGSGRGTAQPGRPGAAGAGRCGPARTPRPGSPG